MSLKIPDVGLVVLIGPSSSGKSTFASRWFAPTEVISSDRCRGLVCDDENSMEASTDAFELVRFLAGKRLGRRRLTVIDATSVRKEDRAQLLAVAREHDVLSVAIVFDLPEGALRERHAQRTDRPFAFKVVQNQRRALREGLRGLGREGFRYVYTFESTADVDGAQLERVPLWTDRRSEHGPFDIIGDVHGCRQELDSLLTQLGYRVDGDSASHPDGRRAIFVGDLVDRGPDSVGALRLAMRMVADGAALCVPGNHEAKLLKALRGKDVKRTHGLERTMTEMETVEPAERDRMAEFIDSLVSHLVLDDGKLVVAHAGLVEHYHNRSSGRVREFCLYGQSTGETDEFGLPVRYPWANDYRGAATVVYGHTPVPRAEWLNRTICIDTGCVFGGALTALRWPERELVSVPALREHYPPARPLVVADPRAGTAVLDHADVSGKRAVITRYGTTVTIRAEQAAPALEIMSRFTVDPRWLVYLPPTMSPCETAPAAVPYLEHPAEALRYYREHGVTEVVLEAKHMGSRAILVVCRDADAARRRFDIEGDGCIYTRTGRPWFDDPAIEAALLGRIREAATKAGLWEELATEWLVLDAELMPWSAKAIELLRTQYAPVASAAEAMLGAASGVLAAAAARDPSARELADRSGVRLRAAAAYRDAYRRYCWTVSNLDDWRIAPFHLLASEGKVHDEVEHRWHLNQLGRLAEHDPILIATPALHVDLADEASCDAAIAWWETLVGQGGEGAVVKPKTFLPGGKRATQPAIKVRGPDYLRIIYGPEYDRPENLDRLRVRGLGTKRSLAWREFAVGMEALHRFVAGEPLYRVHESVFAVLALETEPVDPRL